MINNDDIQERVAGYHHRLLGGPWGSQGESRRRGQERSGEASRGQQRPGHARTGRAGLGRKRRPQRPHCLKKGLA